MPNAPKNRLGLFLCISGWLVAAIFAAMLATDVALQPRRLGAGDTVRISVMGTLPDQPIEGNFVLDAQGSVSMGQTYRAATVDGLTSAEASKVVQKHLEQILNAPEVSLALVESASPSWLRRTLPALGWILALILALLLAATTVRAYTVPEPRRQWLQFSVGTLLWLMVVVALIVFALVERRKRIELDAIRQATPASSTAALENNSSEATSTAIAAIASWAR